MAGSVSTRLSAAEGRKFGLTVGLAFTALALVAWWRGAMVVRAVLLSIGAALIVAGLLIPRHLGPVERAWMKLALAISKVTTPLLMGLIYFAVLTPTGMLRRAFGANSLVRRTGEGNLAAGGYWVQRPPGKRRGNLIRQY